MTNTPTTIAPDPTIQMTTTQQTDIPTTSASTTQPTDTLTTSDATETTQQPDAFPTQSAALVGAIAGGVGGSLLLVIIVLVVGSSYVAVLSWR